MEKYKQFAKYGIVGLLNNLLEIGGLMLMNQCLMIHYIVSNTIVSIIVLMISYMLNNFWTFKNKTISFISIMELLFLNSINVIVGAFLLYIFYSVLGFSLLLSKLFTNCVCVIWSFLIAKKIIYK